MIGLRVTSLASGSSGNAFLVEAGSVSFLLDAGVPTRMLQRELAVLGVSPTRLAAILLTHEHIDHIHAAGVLSRRFRIPLIASPGTFEGGLTCLKDLKGRMHVMRVGTQHCIGEVVITSFALPHDAYEPVGYFIEYNGWRICLATDLGHVPDTIHAYLEAADLVILEANHDRATLLDNPNYPTHLKWRILSEQGHLDNEQTGGVVGQVLGNRPQHLWLAHLSAENNTPEKALRQVGKHLHMAGKHQIVTMEVAQRDRRSVSWCSADVLTQQLLF